jgi:hypothetical protein
MAEEQEHVEFVARQGVTVYTGGNGVGYQAGHPMQLPADHAADLDHLHARHDAKPADEGGKAKKSGGGTKADARGEAKSDLTPAA